MQVFGRKVWTQVRAMSPYRAVLHQAVFEEDLLAAANICSREKRSAIGTYCFFGDRRGIAVASEGEPDQIAKPPRMTISTARRHHGTMFPRPSLASFLA